MKQRIAHQSSASTETQTVLPYQLLCQLITFSAAITLLFLSGCSKRYNDLPAFLPFPMKNYENHSVGRFKTSFLAEQIDNYYRGTNPGPIGITTFVNIDDLYTTSTFGRMYGEQLMSELAMRGFDVIELRHSDALQFLSTDGEFALSREVSSVRPVRELGGVVVGTYVVSPKRVYVNARLVDPASSLVVSAGSVEMSKSKEIARLLRGGTFQATLERIPVKHLGLSTYPLGMFSRRQQERWTLEESSMNMGGVQPQFGGGSTSAKPKMTP